MRTILRPIILTSLARRRSRRERDARLHRDLTFDDPARKFFVASLGGRPMVGLQTLDYSTTLHSPNPF